MAEDDVESKVSIDTRVETKELDALLKRVEQLSKKLDAVGAAGSKGGRNTASELNNAARAAKNLADAMAKVARAKAEYEKAGAATQLAAAKTQLAQQTQMARRQQAQAREQDRQESADAKKKAGEQRSEKTKAQRSAFIAQAFARGAGFAGLPFGAKAPTGPMMAAMAAGMIAKNAIQVPYNMMTGMYGATVQGTGGLANAIGRMPGIGNYGSSAVSAAMQQSEEAFGFRRQTSELMRYGFEGTYVPSKERVQSGVARGKAAGAGHAIRPSVIATTAADAVAGGAKYAGLLPGMAGVGAVAGAAADYFNPDSQVKDAVSGGSAGGVLKEREKMGYLTFEDDLMKSLSKAARAVGDMSVKRAMSLLNQAGSTAGTDILQATGGDILSGPGYGGMTARGQRLLTDVTRGEAYGIGAATIGSLERYRNEGSLSMQGETNDSTSARLRTQLRTVGFQGGDVARQLDKMVEILGALEQKGFKLDTDALLGSASIFGAATGSAHVGMSAAQGTAEFAKNLGATGPQNQLDWMAMKIFGGLNPNEELDPGMGGNYQTARKKIASGKPFGDVGKWQQLVSQSGKYGGFQSQSAALSRVTGIKDPERLEQMVREIESGNVGAGTLDVLQKSAAEFAETSGRAPFVDRDEQTTDRNLNAGRELGQHREDMRAAQANIIQAVANSAEVLQTFVGAVRSTSTEIANAITRLGGSSAQVVSNISEELQMSVPQ